MIATILAVKEEGAVFLCAPSNYAADVLALALSATLNDSGIKCRIVRVLSRTKGRHFLDNDASKADQFPVLHEEVRKSPLWMNDDNMEDLDIIKHHIDNKTEFLLTQAQSSALEAHISSVENEVLQKFDVFIATVGCVGDQRFSCMAKNGDITTVMLDEASQLSQPQTIHMLNLNPARVIFADDPMQLSFTITSQAASAAGLGLSFIDMLPGVDEGHHAYDHKGYPCPPPWITLCGNKSPKRNVGFLTNINRINVALSRAQEFLFVVWNKQFFSTNQLQHFKSLTNLLNNCPTFSQLHS